VSGGGSRGLIASQAATKGVAAQPDDAAVLSIAGAAAGTRRRGKTVFLEQTSTSAERRSRCRQESATMLGERCVWDGEEEMGW
jgi:hypothetical protein